MKALEQGFAALVDYCSLESAKVTFAFLPDVIDGEAGMDRVADNRWLEKAAALFDEHETLDALASVRGSERSHTDHKQAMSQRFTEAGVSRVLDVVVDGVNVACQAGEQKEMRVRQRLRRAFKYFANF